MRHIELEGCFNFRDLGGWRTEDGRATRWGRLFRADAVHLMSEADARCAREELDLQLVLDLRTEFEIEATGTGLLAEAGIARRHLPLASGKVAVIDGVDRVLNTDDRSPEAMSAQYLGMLDASAGLIVDAVGAIATDEGLPAVFFCAAGKDRTGVLSAVLLGGLGVRDADIVEDYVLTENAIVAVIERFARYEWAPDMYRDRPPSYFRPYAETMQRVLGEVRSRYGSFERYLVSNGLDEATLDRLRHALVG